MANQRICVYCRGVCDNRTTRKSSKLPDVKFDGGDVLKNRWIHLDCSAKRNSRKQELLHIQFVKALNAAFRNIQSAETDDQH